MLGLRLPSLLFVQGSGMIRGTQRLQEAGKSRDRSQLTQTATSVGNATTDSENRTMPCVVQTYLIMSQVRIVAVIHCGKTGTTGASHCKFGGYPSGIFAIMLVTLCHELSQELIVLRR
jgi:hypothetical protein